MHNIYPTQFDRPTTPIQCTCICQKLTSSSFRSLKSKIAVHAEIPQIGGPRYQQVPRGTCDLKQQQRAGPPVGLTKGHIFSCIFLFNVQKFFLYSCALFHLILHPICVMLRRSPSRWRPPARCCVWARITREDPQRRLSRLRLRGSGGCSAGTAAGAAGGTRRRRRRRQRSCSRRPCWARCRHLRLRRGWTANHHLRECCGQDERGEIIIM